MASWWTRDSSLRSDLDDQIIQNDLVLDEDDLDLDLLPPYHDAAIDPAHLNLLSPLPSYEEVEAADSNKSDLIRTVIVSIITVLLCFLVIFAVLSHYLSEAAQDSTTSRSRPDAADFNRPANPIASTTSTALITPTASTALTAPTSRNGSLNFVEKYPALDINLSTPECRAAWSQLTAVPCHEAIWMRNWDAGSPPLHRPSLDHYLPLMCNGECRFALYDIQAVIGAACAGQEAFSSVDAGAYESSNLELDPSKVMTDLWKRMRHMCIKPRNAYQDFCMLDMERRWNIIDGYGADGLDDIDSFLNATQVARTEPISINVGYEESIKSTAGSSNTFRSQNRFGPTRQSTTCSWCTLRWFNEKLRLWDEEEIGLQKGMRLVTYLRKWEKAGRRCEGSGFQEIWKSVIDEYKKRGQLDDDWEREPSGNNDYLIANGPSAGDAPVSWAQDIIPEIARSRIQYGPVPSLENAQQAALDDEYYTCLSTFVREAPDLPCFPFLDFEAIKAHLISSPAITKAACSETCFSAISTFTRKMEHACPSARNGGQWDIYDRYLAPNDARRQSDFTLTRYFGLGEAWGTISGYLASCQRVAGSESVPCGAIYAKWGVADWVSSNLVPEPKDLIRVTREQLEHLPEMLEDLAEWRALPTQPTTETDRALVSLFNNWKATMGEGVCSDCMWRRFVPYNATEETILDRMPSVSLDDDVAMEWIKTLHSLEKECSIRGVQFPLQELADVEAAWIKRYSAGLLKKAMNAERE